MSRQHPFIELEGYERLHALERRIAYSPTAIILSLIGLAGGVYSFSRLGREPEVLSANFLLGYGVVLATYLALLAYYYGYRFRRLKCPGCGLLMQAHIADMEEGAWRRLILAFEKDGRYYRRPYGEDDPRPWIRLMRVVRACPRCRRFGIVRISISRRAAKKSLR
jgi:hypothetical protein